MNPLEAWIRDQERLAQEQAAPVSCLKGPWGEPVPQNILVLQLARFGDLVQTWPLLTRLRQAYSGARLTLLTDHRLLPLQAAGPEVDEVLGFDFLRLGSLTAGDWPGAYQLVADFLKSLQTRHFDLVFNLNFSRLSLLLTHLLSVPAKGYLPAKGGREFSREPWLAWIYSLVHARRFNRFHLTDVFRHLAPEPAAVPAVSPLAALQQSEPVIALQLATRHERRTWPLEHFTRLAEHLVSRIQAQVMLMGTPAERPLGEKLKAALAPALRERVLNLQGETGLKELAAQLQQAHLVVSGDTGTLHLAAALKVPAVALFLGPALCFETGPYGSGHYVLQAEPPCHPCTEVASPCPEEGPICLKMLPPEAVARLISGWLETGAAPSDLPLPAGSRLYRSELDNFGVGYRYLGEEPPRFEDLVGEAYRQAGAWLAARMYEVGGGDQGPVAPASSLGTCSGDLQKVEILLAALRRGMQVPPEFPEVAAALQPLIAFQAEMQRQDNQDLYIGVKEVFSAQLENGLSLSR
ncbi:MAG: glycosyltransferase family 9 protein [Syntrophales bacterium]|nr:glycosyltransferase family 9 protein [Syntrophales bacterium]MDD5641449.1 glycosyltransferase family 9 protein [Syntrophales bacterium]